MDHAAVEASETATGYGSYSANDAAYNEFMKDGFRYDTIQDVQQGGTLNGTRSTIAKYVVGPGQKYGGEQVIGMNTGINFMMLRYADILLIYAEATLAGGESTTDATALDAFNQVRLRAGLPTKSVLTIDDIMKERRVEFAFEGDYWFDITRQGYDKAREIIEAQNRGTIPGNPFYVTNFTPDKMFLPIPASEVLQDPRLDDEPEHYYTK